MTVLTVVFNALNLTSVKGSNLGFTDQVCLSDHQVP